jgi:hypothetical protein
MSGAAWRLLWAYFDWKSSAGTHVGMHSQQQGQQQGQRKQCGVFVVCKQIATSADGSQRQPRAPAKVYRLQDRQLLGTWQSPRAAQVQVTVLLCLDYSPTSRSTYPMICWKQLRMALGCKVEHHSELVQQRED